MNNIAQATTTPKIRLGGMSPSVKVVTPVNVRVRLGGMSPSIKKVEPRNVRK
jgi:hypothetical protein